MRILVVEDEPKAAAYMAQGLSEAGYVVDVVGDGEHGLLVAKGTTYGLVICDVMLPGRDGYAVVSELRRTGRQTPILFVSARDEIESRVRGLDVGADDYLTKPFAFAELLARVRALLRRPAPRGADTLALSDLTIDLRARRVERAGQRIDLTPREFALLQFFLEHAGEVLSRTLIADRVWDMQFDSGTNVIDVQVGRLRAKIEDGGRPPLIHTVRGVGYVAEVRES